MILGGTPATAKLTILPIILHPSLVATSRRAKRIAEAPSVIWLELPAVVDPPFWKAGFSLPRPSTVVVALIPSSLSTVTLVSLPSLSLTIVV